MPNQSSAPPTEHALIQEIASPLGRLPADPVPLVADVDFPTTLRGYDRIAVDAYVRKTSQLVAELQATHSPDAAVRRALERVGEEVSGILQRAHETADEITTSARSHAEELGQSSRSQAGERLEAARRDAAEITASAEQRLKELDAETDRIWIERRRIVDDARELSRQLLALADSAAERFPPAEETEPVDQGASANGFGFELMENAELLRGPEQPEGAETQVLPRALLPEDDAQT